MCNIALSMDVNYLKKSYAVLSENVACRNLCVFWVKKLFWNLVRVKFVTNCMSAYTLKPSWNISETIQNFVVSMSFFHWSRKIHREGRSGLDSVLTIVPICHLSGVMCHVSCIMYHVSGVMCQVSCVSCHLSHITFFLFHNFRRKC